MFLTWKESLIKFLENAGMSHFWADALYQFIAYTALIIVAFVVYKLTVIILRSIIIPITRRSKNYFDDLLIKNRFFRRIAFLAPASIIYYALNSEAFVSESLDPFFVGVVVLFFYIIGALVFQSLLTTVNDYYNRFHIAKDHPIAGIIQVLKILVYIVALLGIFGYIFDKDISSILLGLGTLSAVLMLIFKDPILGFVGGLQLIFNKMISIGDWINVPKYGADGTVLELSLTSVKVQNFDKTIVTVPTYSLISGSFQNYRGMQESGGRRIKRAISIDMDSVKFCDEEMLKKYSQIHILADYISKKEEDISSYNKKNKIDPTVIVNGRRQTNLGVFRAYVKAYLTMRSDIHDDMTFLVRQLAPTDTGIPIELYVFTMTTDWNQYEDIQSDIFDHILAVIPEFDLRVFQVPSNEAILQVIKQKN